MWMYTVHTSVALCGCIPYTHLWHCVDVYRTHICGIVWMVHTAVQSSHYSEHSTLCMLNSKFGIESVFTQFYETEFVHLIPVLSVG